MTIASPRPPVTSSINWRVRWRNKTWLGLFLAAVLSACYSLLPLLGITPAVSEDLLSQLIQVMLSLLTAMGVIIDPTTQGIGDSARAMGYEAPWPAHE